LINRKKEKRDKVGKKQIRKGEKKDKKIKKEVTFSNNFAYYFFFFNIVLFS